MWRIRWACYVERILVMPDMSLQLIFKNGSSWKVGCSSARGLCGCGSARGVLANMWMWYVNTHVDN